MYSVIRQLGHCPAECFVDFLTEVIAVSPHPSCLLFMLTQWQR